MNAETLEAIAKVISHIDGITSQHGLTLSGTVALGDLDERGAGVALQFNDGSETTLVAQ
jgi:hypothetical protein